jgi:hypothetical protein
VKVTEQLPEDNVQLAPIVPAAVFDDVKLTVPVGVLAELDVSVTVAVQVAPPGRMTVLGLQDTLVDVLSLTGAVTVMVFDVPMLPL